MVNKKLKHLFQIALKKITFPMRVAEGNKDNTNKPTDMTLKFSEINHQ